LNAENWNNYQTNSVFSAKRRYQMKSPILPYTLIALLALSFVILWLNHSGNDQESTQLFPATVNRDCAPWDGSAFVISIPYDSMSTMEISIWRSPDAKFSTSFSFPDNTGRIGNAALHAQNGSPEQLTGKVFIRSTEHGMEGEFNFFTETGSQFTGRFTAVWGDFIALCG
jgi:hypothetical protein